MSGVHALWQTLNGEWENVESVTHHVRNNVHDTVNRLRVTETRA